MNTFSRLVLGLFFLLSGCKVVDTTSFTETSYSLDPQCDSFDHQSWFESPDEIHLGTEDFLVIDVSNSRPRNPTFAIGESRSLQDLGSALRRYYDPESWTGEGAPLVSTAFIDGPCDHAMVDVRVRQLGDSVGEVHYRFIAHRQHSYWRIRRMYWRQQCQRPNAVYWSTERCP